MRVIKHRDSSQECSHNKGPGLYCWGVGDRGEGLLKQGDGDTHLTHRSQKSLCGRLVISLRTLPPAQGPLITPTPSGGREAL